MYSEQLEAVIDAALADGVLTDKEREVLHKRAMQEGIDPDELDVVIDGRLAKMKKEEDRLRPTPPQLLTSNKVGAVLKCPNCGADYQQGTIKCPECGHEFTNRSAISSATKMNEEIQRIRKEYKEEWDRAHAVADYIINFPIPSTRDDLLEFIPTMAARRHGAEKDIIFKAYSSKLKEAINKARIYFPNDSQMKECINKSRESWWGSIPPSDKFGIIFWIFFALFMVFAAFMAHLEKIGLI